LVFNLLAILVFNLLELLVTLLDEGYELFLAAGHEAGDVILTHSEELGKFCFLVEILISVVLCYIVVLRNCAKLAERTIKLNIRNIK